VVYAVGSILPPPGAQLTHHHHGPALILGYCPPSPVRTEPNR